MSRLMRTTNVAEVTGQDPGDLLPREWLVTNGLGGYACGTVWGALTRRYHGLLIAALPSPFGRMMVLNHLSEILRLPDGRVVQISSEEPTEQNPHLAPSKYLQSFELEQQLPVWRYNFEGILIEKRLQLVHGQNTTHINYLLKSDHNDVQLELHPYLHFRGHDHAVNEPLQEKYEISIADGRFEISAGERWPTLRLLVFNSGSTFTHDVDTGKVFYLREFERGYECHGQLRSPGFFSLKLLPQTPATLVASTEPWATALVLNPQQAVEADEERRRSLLVSANPKAQTGFGAELVLAADQFVITPAGRVEDAARARAAGDEIRTVIAGYHWFTDWGRDTMISLEGLTLCTGRRREAEWILHTFAHYIRDGLIPNFFPDGKNEGVYHTADATLWFFHALDRYVETTHDTGTLNRILPKLFDVIDHHVRGTKFGIHVDPSDGLLHQGQEGYQLTWMDAKVGDWVVTPRRGKAVEINALWYNALRLVENWLRQSHREDEANRIAGMANRVHESFNKRFWNQTTGFLYDVVDGEKGDDPSCRPNQVLSFSLRHPVLEQQYWKPVLDTVRAKLLTPVGLRSLSPDHPDYKPRYFGDLRSRDAAYHQGTVWPWLIGPFIDAWLRLYPGQRAEARKFLEGFPSHLNDGCIGTINEIFDAERPFTPRGCVAQAWSIAEVLRCWIKTAE